MFSETYVVGTQKNPLNETALLSTLTHVLIDEKENNYNYTLIKFPYLDLRVNVKKNVWPGNATPTNCIQTHGTKRKSPRTITAS